MRSVKSIRALERGLDVLQALQTGPGAGLKDLHEITGLPKATLLRILRTWVTENRYGHGDIEGFIALANEVSGEHLRGFFQRWLFERGKP